MNKSLPAVLLFSIILLVQIPNSFADPGDFVGVFASGSELDGPQGLVFGLDGNLYVANRFADNVLRFDGPTGAFIDIFASGGGLNRPQGLVFGPDGNLYVASSFTNEVLRFDGTTGAFIDVFASVGLDSPQGLVFGPDGNLYVASLFTHNVLRFDGTTGAFIDIFASGGGLDRPIRLEFGPDGNLYVVSSLSNSVQRFNGLTGAFIDVFGIVFGARSLVFDPDGNLMVGSVFFNSVERLDGTTGAFIETFASVGGLNPRDLLFGPNENLYVSNTVNDNVLLFEGFGLLDPYELRLTCQPGVEIFLNFPFFHSNGVRILDFFIPASLTCPPDFEGVVLLSEVPNGIDTAIFATVNGQPIASRFCDLDNLQEPPNFEISFDIDPNTGEVFCAPGSSSIASITLIPKESDSKPPVVGGELSPIDSSVLLLAGAQSFSWMIPVIVSGIGIGLFVVSRKSE